MASLFSGREIRALAIFIPLVTLVVVVFVLARPKSSERYAEYLTEQMEATTDSVVLFTFDPNTVDYADLRRLGFSQRLAVSLLKYRETGKVFRIKEDLATCRGVTDSIYFRLEPYISIGREYQIKRRTFDGFERRDRVVNYPSELFGIDTVSATYLVANTPLTLRQAEALVRWRDVSGFRNMAELRRCYTLSDSVATIIEPYVVFTPRIDPAKTPVEINSADSATLRAIRGIGEKSVVEIIRYRTRLGGFYSGKQLAEVPKVMESNFEMILKQIYCDSSVISKIDINFASADVIGKHPYVAPKTLRKLLKIRQLKGGWSTKEEMIKDNIFTIEEATKLAPYLDFRVQPTKY